ncbi:GtrA family protein [Yoonia sp. R2-816]|uniref:GtrA family protein n=1 Tax=Yoonia sp. R2-816 TaxID=3342638 RepID=UPI00372AA42B
MVAQEQVARFGRYGVVGIASNLFCFLVFLGLIAIDIWPVLASGMVYILGLTISYIANRSWSFRSTSDHRQDLPRFLVSYGIGLVFSMASMWVLIMWLHPAVAQIITTVLAAIVIYSCLTVFKFGQGTKHYAD